MSLRLRLCIAVLIVPLLLLSTLAGWQLHADAKQRHQALVTRLSDDLALLSPTRTTPPGIEAQRLAAALSRHDAVRTLTIRTADDSDSTALGARPRLSRHDSGWHLELPLTPATTLPSVPRWVDLTIRDSAIDLPFYRQLAWYGLAWIMSALILGGLYCLLCRRLLASLDAQHDALQRLYAGDYRFRLSASGARELAATNTAINALGEHLQTAQADMRRQVEQATADWRESMNTIEVQNIELDGARQRALEANRVKSEFLANVSHEIRTPLNGIIGFCRLLGRSRLDDHQYEWLKHIEMASANLLSLINDILDFSKIEAGKLKLASLELDMAELVDEVLVLQAPDAQQKDLQLLGLVYDDVPSALFGDPQRIKQVLTNLVHNAVKFTESGEVIVRVQVEEVHASEMTLSVTVSDTGMGLAADVQQRLFQPFNQGSATSASHAGGTGLGLMICKQLVEQMGGDIEAQSRPDPGTTFTFTLPLRTTLHATERVPAITLDAARIAIHEPHKPTRLALNHLLRSWGAEVQVLDVTPTQATLAVAANTQLAIIALNHDDLASHAFKAWRQRLAELPCPPLLVLNGEPQIIEEELLPPEEARLFYKPLTRTRLAQALKALLRPSPSPRTSAPDRPHVLVVDDIETNRLLVAELLTQMDVDSRLAASGEEALELAHAQRFDLVLMDIRMPGMNGLEAMAALRRLGGNWADCPFVALTAHAIPNDSQALLDAGMQAVLTKPLDADALEHMLVTYLGIQGSAGPSHTTETAIPVDAELAIVDGELGVTLAGGRPALAEHMLESLLASLDTSEAELRKHYATNDEQAFLDAVHHLNGACRYCGVPQLALVAETLESRLRAQGIAAVDDVFATLLEAMQRLRDWRTNQPPRA